jgi:muramoyltetrapeptide carboxypeptidase
MEKIQQYLFPQFLTPGDKIGVIAPASAAPRSSIIRGVDYLVSQGYHVKSATNLVKRKYYLAGSNEERSKILEEFILDPEVVGLFCARGGYGVLRILDRLDYGRLGKVKPKMIVGYSDITGLHLALLSCLGWIGYSGPMVASDLGNNFDPFSEKWFWKVVSQHPYPLMLENPEGDEMKVWRPGVAEGTLLGGCLSIITALLGTPYLPSLQGAILLIEDIGEQTYRLDKQLQILRLHGVFDQIAGMLIGHFVKCFPRNSVLSFTLEELLKEIIGDYNFPVITNLAYGHIRRRLTIPIGARVRLETDPVKVTILGA